MADMTASETIAHAAASLHQVKQRLESHGEVPAYIISLVDDAIEAIEDAACAECGVVEGTPEYGTVGDGFDGYCPSCADKRDPVED